MTSSSALMFCTYALYAYLVRMPCTHTLYVCLVRTPCTYAMYEHFVRMPCTHALYLCLIRTPCTHALYACLVRMPCTHALYLCLVPICSLRHTVEDGCIFTLRAAFQLSVFYTYVHARKSLNSSKHFVFNK